MLFGLSQRDKILVAAFDLFTTRGFEKTRMSEIQTNARVALRTFYKHFRSKEQLVNEIYQALRRLLEAYLNVAIDERQSPRVQFHNLWLQMAAFHQNYPNVVAFLENRHHGAYLDQQSRPLEQVPRPLIELMERLHRDQIAKDAPVIVLGTVVWGTFVEMIKLCAQEHLSLSGNNLKAAEECTWDAVRAVANKPPGPVGRNPAEPPDGEVVEYSLSSTPPVEERLSSTASPPREGGGGS